jgi:hypothetical protein
MMTEGLEGVPAACFCRCRSLARESTMEGEEERPLLLVEEAVGWQVPPPGRLSL